MLRIFLDANVLFSAAYREKAGLMRLWSRPGAELVTSAYAAEEARRNLASADQRARLEGLLSRMRIVAESDAPMPACVELPEKDHPILKAAIAAGATHLVTGDVRDFGRYFGKRIAGILVVTPAESRLPLKADPLYRAKAVGRSKDGLTAAEHDLTLYGER